MAGYGCILCRPLKSCSPRKESAFSSVLVYGGIFGTCTYVAVWHDCGSLYRFNAVSIEKERLQGLETVASPTKNDYRIVADWECAIKRKVRGGKVFKDFGGVLVEGGVGMRLLVNQEGIAEVIMNKTREINCDYYNGNRSNSIHVV